MSELHELRKGKFELALGKHQVQPRKLCLTKIESLEPTIDLGQLSPSHAEPVSPSTHRINVSKNSLPALLNKIDREEHPEGLSKLPPINPFAKKMIFKPEVSFFHRPKLSADV